MKIGDWPFKRSGVDCRECRREPCVCRHRYALFPYGPELDDYFTARMLLASMEVGPTKTGKPAVRSVTSGRGSRRGRRPKK